MEFLFIGYTFFNYVVCPGIEKNIFRIRLATGAVKKQASEDEI
jgi:hypothetical protein